ncbi:hypothetical protein CTEN210_02900 [Chaetoceros tenuissimus]|uniref:RING-type domain-containing protein n=1 Tax=Chaetoceros tenuissimus TaxID=426638 RepID=A0AAD3H143_9STRA|nr:hypothetical protein CTEN210_02900 [Chaetoceros tenuissimus]
MGQQASRQSDTSSQTIHDADTLISTSGSSNNEALGYDADAAIEVESDTDNIDSDVYGADDRIEVESDTDNIDSPVYDDTAALDVDSDTDDIGSDVYNAERRAVEEESTAWDADSTDSELEYDADRVINDRSRVRNALSDSEDFEYDAEAEDSDSEEMEWVQETGKRLFEACENKNWEIFQKFLSDESIAKKKKKLVLDKNEECRDMALRWGAPLPTIKYLIDIEGPDAISIGECSWLHTAMMYECISFEVVKLLVDIGGKDLVMMQSARLEHRKRTALHIHLGVGFWRHQKIIELLVRVGGVELLEIEDEDGYRIVDYCLEHERALIFNFLRNTYDARFFSTQKHLKTLQSLFVKATPKEIYCWIARSEFDKVNNYLHDGEVSREAKQRCFNYRDSQYNRSAFFYLCVYNDPGRIAASIIDLMGTDFLMISEAHGYTYLHATCKYLNGYGDHELQLQHGLVQLLLGQGGTALLCATNYYEETALHNLLSCNRVNFDSINLMVDIGGKDFLLKTDMNRRTALHLASMQREPNKDVLLYLISEGGSDLRDISDHCGRKAEDYWSPELKQYIDLHTKTSPALSDDLQCPICFEIMNDVHIISQCCHRFCKKCITDAFLHNSKCPVCRAEYTIGELRKDPLLCKFAILAKEKENQLKEANEKNDILLVEKVELMQEKVELLQAKKDLATLKRKYNEMSTYFVDEILPFAK